jgi:CBS domain-containing protein
MMQVQAFLARYPPFDGLPPDDLARIAEAVQIGYFPAGTTILRRSGEPARFLYVVRRGAVELLDGGRVVDLLEEGELFGHPSLLSGLSPGMEVRTHDDTLCYLVDHALATEVFATPSGLSFLASSLRRRSVRALDAREAERADPRLAAVGGLIRRAPVTCAPETPVEDAAGLMARERISSLLIEGERGLGILTDRDLRTRVLAAGRSPHTPVEAVMSSPVVTVRSDATLEEVLLAMLEHGVHHMPVRGPDDHVIGVVTDTDMMGLERTGAFALRSSIERAATSEALSAQLLRLPEVVCALVRADVRAVHVGHAVAVAIDAATRRLIDLAISELGDPPGPWAWLALGSEARHEQALATDQDHALAFERGSATLEEADAYFARLAERVTDGLAAGGIPRCRGNVMAVNAAWRRTSAGWAGEFRRWMSDPSWAGRTFTSIALDYRRVAGPLDVEPALDTVIREAPAHPAFVKRLANTAIDLRPPTGFFRDLVVEGSGSHAGTLDIKEGGIKPVTNLARTYAVSAGLSGNRTLRRLQDAAGAGRIDASLAAELGDAFQILWEVRLDHHVRMVESGEPLDDHVDPTSIGPILRSGLKEAFRTISRAQGLLDREIGLGIV